MHVYFGGAEAPTLRRRILDAGARNVVVNFQTLITRNLANYDLSRMFPDDVRIILYPGLTSAWSNPERLTAEEWSEFTDHYHEVVGLNIDRIDFAIEFAFGSMEFMEHHRGGFWAGVEPDKFGAVLLPGQPAAEVCASFDRVVVPASGMTDEDARMDLRGAMRLHKPRVHLMGSVDGDLLREINPATLSTTTWTGPARYGEWLLWDGHRLRRTKDAGEVSRMKSIVSALGCDPKKVTAGDPEESSRLAIVSIQHLVERLSPGDVPDTNAPRRSIEVAPAPEPEPDTTPKSEATKLTPHRPKGDRVVLPIVQMFDQTKDGKTSLTSTVADADIRRCGTCSLASWCPEADPEADGCAYSIPAQIRTHDQLIATAQTLLELQQKRAMFAIFAEDVQGGMPTKTGSMEMERWFKIAEKLKVMQEDAAYVKITAEARGGGGGMLAELFGSKPAQLDPGHVETILGEVVED